MIICRTFEALQHPKGSPERKRLNEDGVTSEYCTNIKYYFVSTRWGHQGFRTKAEAEEAQQLYRQSQ